MPDEKDERPRWHGGTLGDRFADQGHAAPLETPRVPKRNPAGRTCFGLATQMAVAGLVAAALVVVPFLPERSAVRR